MARIPSLRRLVIEDFPEQSKWIGTLLEPLNSLFGALVTAFDHGLTFQDNIACQIKTVSFLNDGNAFPLKFNNTLKTRPNGVLVVDCREDSSAPATITNAVWPHWDYTQSGQVQINNLSGLTSGKRYKVTFFVF